jgi:hypothetical protein
VLVNAVTEKVPGQAENEDGLVVRGPVVGVFDGVSAPPGLESGCVHSVAWYVHRLTTRLEEIIDLGGDLQDMLEAAIRKVRDDHNGQCDLDNPSTPAATVCLVREAEDQLEYLLLSDCTLLLDDGADVRSLTDPRFQQAVASIEYPDPDSPNSLDLFQEYTRQKQRLTNNPGGYWIAAADPVAARNAITGALPLKGLKRAALLTDGASRAVDIFGLFGWRELLDLITEKGPQELISRVREAERSVFDLSSIEGLEYKRHDDATAALCLFNS